MARIRTIKPEFWGSPTVARLSFGARLLFLGLISNADDEGRLLGSARAIAGSVFPNDLYLALEEVETCLVELADVGAVQRYQVDGVDYVVIVGWHDHQKIGRPTPSRLPPPPTVTEDADTQPPRVAVQSTPRSTLDLGPTTVDRGPPPEGASAPVGKLVAGYVDAYRDSHGGRDPDRSWRDSCGKAVKRQLDGGRDPCEIERALAIVAGNNKNPSSLVNVLADLDSGVVKSNGSAPAPALESKPGYYREWTGDRYSAAVNE